MTQPNNFNERVFADPIIYRGYLLRTELLVGSTWVHVGSFMENVSECDPWRLPRHAEAFGGQLRLMRAGMVLARWEDGELVEDEVAA